MHLKHNFIGESELKEKLDFIYSQSSKGKSFHGIIEVAYIKNYKAKPVKRIYIEKKNGKMRPLGIPIIIDRIIQECLRIVLEPIVEAKFYPNSYGFRPYRATKHAVKDITALISGGRKNKPIYAIEGDISGYFDNINHKILLKKLWRIGIHDKRVLSIIKEILKAGYVEDGKLYKTDTGTVQGGIISPLLANVYLNDFDWFVGKMYLYPKRKWKHLENDPLFKRRKETIFAKKQLQ